MKIGSVRKRGQEQEEAGGSRRMETPLQNSKQLQNNHASQQPALEFPFLKDNITCKYLHLLQRETSFRMHLAARRKASICEQASTSPDSGFYTRKPLVFLRSS